MRCINDFYLCVNNLPLILFDMTTKIPACEVLYSKSLHSYKEYVRQHGDISLACYCKIHRILYCGMKRWLSEQQISIMDLRRSLRNARSEAPTQSATSPSSTTSLRPPSPSIIPIQIHGAVCQNEPISSVISKVKITYPTGIAVEFEDISQISIKYILSLIH